VVQTIDPDGGTNPVVYTRTGKLQVTIDKPGHFASFTYDFLDRVVGTKYAHSTTTGFAYDPNGNRTSAGGYHWAWLGVVKIQNYGLAASARLRSSMARSSRSGWSVWIKSIPQSIAWV
jgi:YD repeat-containing protein